MNSPIETQSEMGSLVLVPSFNEAENILVIINRLVGLNASLHVLVVDDGSPDGTGKLVESHTEFGRAVFLLSRAYKSGYAGACKEGFNWALEHGYTACVTMDADLSHDPADVPLLLAEIEQGADLAIGSRYKNGIRIINWPIRRLLLSSCAGLYIRTLCGLQLSDPTSGFKAISHKTLRAVDMDKCAAEGYGFIVEFHFFSWLSGKKIVEVPIIFTERRDGASKMSSKIILESAVTVLRLALLRFLPMGNTRRPRNSGE
ncbi:polyprenol monophosphomannose synthase [soil metagenome]